MMNENYEVLDFYTIKETVSRYCSFNGGKQRILELEPRFSKLYVNVELARAKEALQCTISYGEMPFTGIRDITKLVMMAQKGMVLSPLELLWVASHNTCVRSCIQYIQKVECKVEYLSELTSSLSTFDKMQRENVFCQKIGNKIIFLYFFSPFL